MSKNEIMVFENSDFGKIRALEIDGEPWMVGKDVAAVLGYERPSKAILDHLDDDDRMMVDGKTQSRFGIELGQRGGWLINESGLYSLIFSSQLPEAKKFKHWVTSEVLPTIRKMGSYHMSSNALELEARQMLQALSGWMSSVDRRITKIEQNVSYANHYLRLQMRSGYDENWERRQIKNVRAISEFIGKPDRSILAEIYREMEARFGITLSDFCQDYKRTKGLTTCSTLSVISFSLTLREMFDVIVGEIMEICKLNPAIANSNSHTHLFRLAAQTVESVGI